MSDGPVLLGDGSAPCVSPCDCFVSPFVARNYYAGSVIAAPCAQHAGQMAVALFPRSKREAVERALRGGE